MLLLSLSIRTRAVSIPSEKFELNAESCQNAAVPSLLVVTDDVEDNTYLPELASKTPGPPVVRLSLGLQPVSFPSLKLSMSVEYAGTANAHKRLVDSSDTRIKRAGVIIFRSFQGLEGEVDDYAGWCQ
jgi:hypothetical protein